MNASERLVEFVGEFERATGRFPEKITISKSGWRKVVRSYYKMEPRPPIVYGRRDGKSFMGIDVETNIMIDPDKVLLT